MEFLFDKMMMPFAGKRGVFKWSFCLTRHLGRCFPSFHAWLVTNFAVHGQSTLCDSDTMTWPQNPSFT